MLLTDTPPPENMTAKGHENHTGIGHFESVQKKKKHDSFSKTHESKYVVDADL